MAKEKKFLDYDGVKHLWSKINMQDYPNNDMLMSVIQAIDDTKMDKLETVVFSGQYTTNSGRIDFPELTQDMMGKIGILYDYRGSIVAKNPIEAHREPGTSATSYPYWEGGGFYFLPYWLSEDGKDGWHTTRGDNETERYTFSIITLLDEKYIPSTIARVNDIPEAESQVFIVTYDSVNDYDDLGEAIYNASREGKVVVFQSGDNFYDLTYSEIEPFHAATFTQARWDGHVSSIHVHYSEITNEDFDTVNYVNTAINNLSQGLTLTDTVTGVNYLITVTNGKLTMKEV